MTTKLLVLVLYFLAVLAIGYLTRTRWGSTPSNYFLADLRLGTLVLLATMAATNFSAFTVFGTSGAGYRDGWGFFPIMGFGTGFMALSFWLIGRRAWRVGCERGIITPAELVQSLYGSRILGVLFALVMILFTVPYLALQPMAAGYALQEITGLPYRHGSVLVTGMIVLYTLRGGMRGESICGPMVTAASIFSKLIPCPASIPNIPTCRFCVPWPAFPIANCLRGSWSRRWGG